MPRMHNVHTRGMGGMNLKQLLPRMHNVHTRGMGGMIPSYKTVIKTLVCIMFTQEEWVE